ncbi:unnamed protein product [Zymoseptoria tritici ST99CH_3D7]|uniref:Apple domain-containing protein n=1 Tax=Zymoseptoria tritici (strain ST99CH_3D7) TaxID=1276538 RepID=A0A1X7RRZ6_ZYMT9|nr:unnamed protein product [Zymoseptoria tritici ST99CH_3D7]
MAFLSQNRHILAASALLLNALVYAQGVGEPVPDYNPTFTTAPISIFPTTTESLFSTSTASDPATYTAPVCPQADNTPYTNGAGQDYTIRCPASWFASLSNTTGIATLDGCLILCTTYGDECGAAVYDEAESVCSLGSGEEDGGALLLGNLVVGVKVVVEASSTTSATSVITESAPVYAVPATTTTTTSLSSSAGAPPAHAAPSTSSSAVAPPAYSDPALSTSSSAVAPPAYSDPALSTSSSAAAPPAYSEPAPAPPAYSPPPGACTFDTPTASQSTLTGLEYTLSCASRCAGGATYDTSTVSNGYVDCFALCDYDSGCGGFTFTGQDDQGGAGAGTCELMSAPEEPVVLYLTPASRGTVGGVRGEAVLVGGSSTTSAAQAPPTMTTANDVPTVIVTPVQSAAEYETVVVTPIESPTGGETVVVTPVPGASTTATEESSVMVVVPFPGTSPSSGLTSTETGSRSVILDLPTPVTPSASPSSASVVIVTPVPAITTQSTTNATAGPVSMSLSSYFNPTASTTGVCLPRPCSVCTKVTTVIAVSATPAIGAYIVGGVMG